MKLIYIEATKEEIQENKTLAGALCDTISGFFNALVEVKPVITAEYKLKEEENESET